MLSLLLNSILMAVALRPYFGNASARSSPDMTSSEMRANVCFLWAGVTLNGKYSMAEHFSLPKGVRSSRGGMPE